MFIGHLLVWGGRSARTSETLMITFKFVMACLSDQVVSQGQVRWTLLGPEYLLLLLRSLHRVILEESAWFCLWRKDARFCRILQSMILPLGKA